MKKPKFSIFRPKKFIVERDFLLNSDYGNALRYRTTAIRNPGMATNQYGNPINLKTVKSVWSVPRESVAQNKATQEKSMNRKLPILPNPNLRSAGKKSIKPPLKQHYLAKQGDKKHPFHASLEPKTCCSCDRKMLKAELDEIRDYENNCIAFMHEFEYYENITIDKDKSQRQLRDFIRTTKNNIPENAAALCETLITLNGNKRELSNMLLLHKTRRIRESKEDTHMYNKFVNFGDVEPYVESIPEYTDTDQEQMLMTFEPDIGAVKSTLKLKRCGGQYGLNRRTKHFDLGFNASLIYLVSSGPELIPSSSFLTGCKQFSSDPFLREDRLNAEVYKNMRIDTPSYSQVSECLIEKESLIDLPLEYISRKEEFDDSTESDISETSTGNSPRIFGSISDVDADDDCSDVDNKAVKQLRRFSQEELASFYESATDPDSNKIDASQAGMKNMKMNLVKHSEYRKTRLLTPRDSQTSAVPGYEKTITKSYMKKPSFSSLSRKQKVQVPKERPITAYISPEILFRSSLSSSSMDDNIIYGPENEPGGPLFRVKVKRTKAHSNDANVGLMEASRSPVPLVEPVEPIRKPQPNYMTDRTERNATHYSELKSSKKVKPMKVKEMPDRLKFGNFGKRGGKNPNNRKNMTGEFTYLYGGK